MQKFREEDEKLSSTEAFMRRSDLLKRVCNLNFNICLFNLFSFVICVDKVCLHA